MAAVLYAMAASHPSQAVRKMLELKQVEYDLVEVLPFNQRVHLRLAGFRGGTVPALKLDGHTVQGSRAISSALDARWPEPPLFPSDPRLRTRVEEAERWGDEALQPIPRRLFRFGFARRPELRRWAMQVQGLPAPGVLAAALQPVAVYYARTVEADGQRATDAVVRADLAGLPGMLDRVDQLLADGTLTAEAPNAATLQVLSTVRAIDAFEDLSDHVRAHACAGPALELFEPPPARVPRFVDPEWLRPLEAPAAAS